MATPEAFRRDPRSPRIERAVAAILPNRKVVAPVDVFVRMDIHLPKDLDDSRFGRVPCLERVIHGSLWRLSRLLRILGYHYCHDLNLVASQTAYVEWRKGAGTPYRFTKTGEQQLQRIWPRHFVWPAKGPFHPPREWPDAGA
jgi:hypothetical protein